MKARKSAAAVHLLSSMGLILATTPVLAEPKKSPHEFSANLALTTNYMFRGISQTSNGPAVQGGFDYKYHPYHFYAGVWASNVDSSPAAYNGASMELDLYAGLTPSWKNFDFDLGYISYRYPRTKTSKHNSDEFHLGVSYADLGYFTPSYTVRYSDDFFGLDPAWYHDLSVEVPLFHGFTLVGHYGWNWFDDRSENYQDYSAGISKEYRGFEFDLSWVDRSDEKDCSAPFECGNTTVFTLSKSF